MNQSFQLLLAELQTRWAGFRVAAENPDETGHDGAVFVPYPWGGGVLVCEAVTFGVGFYTGAFFGAALC